MRYENVVADFAERTQKNLETIMIIQRKQTDNQIFEVTQLINSMLGLLIFPKEAYFNRIPRAPISEMAKQGWPIPRIKDHYQQPKTLRDLIRLLRNAIAHFNIKFIIKFITDEKNQISGLIVWNETDGIRNWEAELSLTDLEGITYRFIELLRKEKLR